MREQDGQLGRRKNVAGGSAEDHLPQATLRIGPFDQQIRVHRSRLGEDRFAWTVSRQPAYFTARGPGRLRAGVTVFSVAAMPLASRCPSASLTLGPGTIWPSTATNDTRFALRSSGIAKRIARAVSVLAFQ